MSVQLKSFGQTSYLHIEGPPTKPIVFYIPGNPGVCDYYTEYITELHKHTGLECIVSSQLGSDIHHESQGFYTLDDQIRHKLEFLDQFKSRRLYVLGHSIGAWMAQRVAIKCPNVEFVGLMTPTLSDIALSHRGQLLTKFKDYAGFWGVSAAVGVVKLINWLPDSVLGWVLRFVTPNAAAAIPTAGIVRHPNVVHQILVMGFEEMDRVDSHIEGEDIAGFWDLDANKWLFYAQNDHWVPDRTRAKTIEFAGDRAQVQLEDVAHAFVLNDSKKVAKWTSEAMLAASQS